MIDMHYSVPGLPAHRARTTSLEDAMALAQRVANVTGTTAAILLHSADVDATPAKEVITLHATVEPQ